MPQYILAHDLGTSGDKASLFSEKGILIASHTQEYKTFYPHSGWAEQNPTDWWQAVCQATRKITEKIDGNQIAAIAVTGQMMGTVPLGKNGELLGNSIIWSDNRAGEECHALVQRLGQNHYYEMTGQPPSASYSLPKIMWLKKYRPDQYENTFKYIQAKDYINYCLTGQIFTDYTDAAYMAAFDIKSRCWSEEILNASGIDEGKLPHVRDSREIIGMVTSRAAKNCGLIEGIPVVVGAGDGSSAHLGAGCVETGDAYVCLGSSTWIVAQTEHLIFDGNMRMQSEPHVLDGKYCFLGTMQTGGLAHSWGRKSLASQPLSYQEIDRLIGASQAGANGMLFLPYLMGERSPWYDLQSKAAFLGVHIHSGYEDFYRAILEGVAMNLNILLNVMREYTTVNRIVAIGGGARSEIWMQILADVFHAEIAVSENIEAGTSIGGAIIAGVGCGMFENYAVAKKFLKIRKVIEPNSETAEYYQQRQPVFEAAYLALKHLNLQM